MHYEIHLTIDEANIGTFKFDCEILSQYIMSHIKPIVILTQNEQHTAQQVMTSSKHYGETFEDCMSTLNRIKLELEGFGYTIIREKIEKLPESTTSRQFVYYESHVRCKINKANFDEVMQRIKEAAIPQVHLSKNLFKEDKDYNYQMLTYRDYNPNYKSFILNIQSITESLRAQNVEFDKLEIEECIHDSNASVDSEWMKKYL